MNKKNKIKTKKLKKFLAFILVVFMMIINFSFLAFFNIIASAADETPPPIVVSVNMPSTVQSGNTFEAIVTFKNNTSNSFGTVTATTDNTSGGIISLTTSNNLKKTVNANSEVSYSFYFNVGSTSLSYDIKYDITFTFTSSSGERTETRSITVVPAPAPVVADTRPNFEIVSDMYPKTAETGTDMMIIVRFSNIGANATNVKISINPPEGVEAQSVAPRPAVIMTTGQIYFADFDYKVTEKAKTGLNIFKVMIECNELGMALTYDIGVIFEKGEGDGYKNNPNINIASTQIPENIKKSEKFEIKAILENTGAEVKDIEVSMEFPNGILNFSADVIQIDYLNRDEQTEILFEAFVTDSIIAKYHPFLMHIDYYITDDDGNPKEIRKTQYMGLNVLDDMTSNFLIDVKIPETVKPGEDFKVSVTVKNTGADEKNFFLKIEPPVDIINKTVNNFSIGELAYSSEITYEVMFNATEEAAGKYCLFGISLYKKQTGNSDIILADKFTGTSVANIELPKIIIDSVKIPQNVNIGETFDVDITVSNIGAADAENIILAVNNPAGILNKTANIVKIDSVKSGKKETVKFTFIVTQNTSYGYNPFDLDLSYPSKSNAGGEKINQYFGLTVNSSDLRIESVRIPNSIGINIDFNVDVAIKNTGADTTDVMISLSPQGGLINKSSNIIKIDSIKSGETIVKSFTFMASEATPSGYSPITVVLSHGEESITQYSGTVVNNPKNEDDKTTDKTDIPVIIISKFIYKNLDDGLFSGDNNSDNNINENNNNGDYDFNNGIDIGLDPVMPVMPRTEREDAEDIKDDIFANTSAVSITIDAPAVAYPASGYSSAYDYNYPDNGSFGSSFSSGSSGTSSIDTNAVYGGKTFMFTIELLNTHKSVAVKDLKITFSQEHGIFNPKSGSNTFFVEWLEPGETTEIEIPLLVKSDAAPDSYGITISLSYKSESGEPTASSEIINIPVQQEMRFSIGDLPPINDIEMGDEAYINVQFGNLGKSKIYNVAVRVQGDGFMNYDGTYYAGTIDAGSSFLNKEFTLTPYNPGFLNGTFIFTYEDADGNSFQEECPFFFNVMGGEDMFEMPPMEWWDEEQFGPDGQPVMNPEGETEESEGFWLFTNMNFLKWAIIISSGLVIIAAVVVVIVIIVKKTKKKNIYDDDDDL
ncbi:MAG: hypothetical protein FWF92_04335 [Oscillospiraceae bacterium]|nr:hypothetical protein [Oscillospiraceae bacterium]